MKILVIIAAAPFFVIGGIINFVWVSCSIGWYYINDKMIKGIMKTQEPEK